MPSQVIQYLNISFQCIRWMERQYSTPAYVQWINIHFQWCNMISRPPLSHQNAHIKSFNIWIFHSDISGECIQWMGKTMFYLCISGGLIYTVDNVIWSPDYYCITAMLTLHTNPQCLNISFQCIHSMERQYPIPACSMDEYTFNNVLWFPVDQYSLWTMLSHALTSIKAPEAHHYSSSINHFFPTQLAQWNRFITDCTIGPLAYYWHICYRILNN
jgi:hypothetical protein